MRKHDMLMKDPVFVAILESARRGELENIFTVTNQYNLTIPNNEGFRAACKSLLLNDQTTLIIIGSARFHRKVINVSQKGYCSIENFLFHGKVSILFRT